MKKIFTFAFTALLLGSCNKSSSNNGAGVGSEDTIEITDTTVSNDTGIKAMPQEVVTIQDTVEVKGKIAEEQKEPAPQKNNQKYEGLIKDYETVTNKLAGFAKSNDISEWAQEIEPVLQKCYKLNQQISKIQDELSPDQLQRFQNARQTYDENIGFFVG